MAKVCIIMALTTLDYCLVGPLDRTTSQIEDSGNQRAVGLTNRESKQVARTTDRLSHVQGFGPRRATESTQASGTTRALCEAVRVSSETENHNFVLLSS